MSNAARPRTVSGFHHIAMKVADFDAAVRFYKEGLGLPERIGWGEGDSRAVMLDTGNGNYIEIFAGGKAGEKPEGALLHLALRTDDVDTAVARAVAAGATVTVEPKEVTIPSVPEPTPVRLAFIRGPAGEIIEFFDNERT
jgi:glyoxylase I family protein